MTSTRDLPLQERRLLVRPCRADEHDAVLTIINTAAKAYRDVIPADRWHEPYMPLHELESEIAAGVEFWGYEADDRLAGVMGIQAVQDVDLIRHAYVLPEEQGQAWAVRCSGTCGAAASAGCWWEPGLRPCGPSAFTSGTASKSSHPR